MKRIFALLTIICYIQFACNKTAITSSSLDGKWRMVLVRDNASGFAATKPSSVQGEVEITFVPINESSGTFAGHTTINEVEGSFLTGEKQSLSIPTLSMTQINENSWGNDFVDNFRNAQSYYFESSERLDITSANKALSFQRE